MMTRENDKRSYSGSGDVAIDGDDDSSLLSSSSSFSSDNEESLSSSSRSYSCSYSFDSKSIDNESNSGNNSSSSKSTENSVGGCNCDRNVSETLRDDRDNNDNDRGDCDIVYVDVDVDVDEDDDDDDEDNKVASVSRTVREWTRSVPIGMNLCPWAKLSDKEGRIRYVTCKEEVSNPQQASRVLSKEILRLVQNETKQQQQKEQQQHSPAAQGTPSPERKDGGAHEYRDGPRCKRPLPPWSTTLVICPYVEEWKNDFETFRAFVENFGSACTDPNAKVDATEKQKNNDHRNAGVTLVPFHPLFVRWRGLPEGIGTGSEVFCHKGLAGFGKSPGVFRATVLDPRPEAFGRRRVRVRFHDSDNNCGNANRNNIVDGKQQTATRRCTVEQYVPVDWVVPDEDTFNSSSNNVVGNGNDRRDVGHNSRDPPTKTSGEGLWHRPPLPDNAMHQAPYPVVHILRN